MLNSQEATTIVTQAIPNGKIQSFIKYKGLYIFKVFTDHPGEEEFDPFYSVNMITSEIRDFSIITDGDPSEIIKLFIETETSKERL